MSCDVTRTRIPEIHDSVQTSEMSRIYMSSWGYLTNKHSSLMTLIMMITWRVLSVCLGRWTRCRRRWNPKAVTGTAQRRAFKASQVTTFTGVTLEASRSGRRNLWTVEACFCHRVKRKENSDCFITIPSLNLTILFFSAVE